MATLVKEPLLLLLLLLEFLQKHALLLLLLSVSQNALSLFNCSRQGTVKLWIDSKGADSVLLPPAHGDLDPGGDEDL